MIKRPFFGCGKPKLAYAGTEGLNQGDIKDITPSKQAVFFLEAPFHTAGDTEFQVGDAVKTGQTLRVSPFSKTTFTSPVTGTISDIKRKKDYLGKNLLSIGVDVSTTDELDDEYAKAMQTLGPENAARSLSGLPGIRSVDDLFHADTPLETIVINGMDKDLLVKTQQMAVKTRADDLKEGIEYLKKMTGDAKVILVVPAGLSSEAAKSGVDVRTVAPAYPNSLPQMIMKDVLNKVVPAGKSARSLGVGFITAEAVVALKAAATEGKPPATKLVTIIEKDENTHLIRVRIGTPIHEILSALNIPLESGDRLVVGGPMTGRSIYSEEMPVLPDTDAIMVQGKEQIVMGDNDPCINCGECIRACPVRIPVNMLVRLLENSQYENAADEYDLLACIECGLCSYVCESKIPIFHYIMLGKYELRLMENAEESAHG